MSQIEKTVKTFDEHGDSYSETIDEAVAIPGLTVDFFTRVKADYLRQVVTGALGDPSRLSLLDVGCGVGNFHPLLTASFGQVAGVDISPASIEIAAANNPTVPYRVYDGGTLPYADESYDVVVTVCVMHHVEPAQWPGFVQELKRVLKPGGLAVVFEHNPRNPLTMRIVNRCVLDVDAVLLSQKTALALFNEADFAAVNSRFILALPAANGALRWLDQLLGRIPVGAQYFVTATKG